MAYLRKVEHASGKRSWQATILTAEGKRRAKNFQRKGDADAWVRQNDKASASGSATMTMLELARAHGRWFDGLVKAGARGQRSADGYASHLERHLATDDLARAALADVDTPRLQRFLDGLVERGVSLETARRLRVTLVAWCNYGVRNGWLKANVARECNAAPAPPRIGCSCQKRPRWRRY